ncbi:hypothetical protein [Amycolatopsis sp. NPDC051371]|uniref:hypothetical protein n=1 Tax=Amycolatopsis sp. NPDC051371 TaxID=3155800 RepID=UPI003436CD1F
MTEGKWIPGGRLPAKAALALAIFWTVGAIGSGFLAWDGGVSEWQSVVQVVVTVAWLVLAGCYWFRYVQARGNR